jgi:hypothetical protein
MNQRQLRTFVMTLQATEAYNQGQNELAAQIYERTAQLSLEEGDLLTHVHCLRWTGNSLMWAYRHDEAYQWLLRAVSFHEHPAPMPEDLYAAMTDLCLLCVRCRSASQTRAILEQTREYLERRQRQAWSHRLDRLEALLLLKRGDPAGAHALACRGWQGMLAAKDGPRYQNSAYLDAMFRGALGMENAREMDRVLDLFVAHAEPSITTSRVRATTCRAMRHAFNGVNPDNRDTLGGLAREVVDEVGAKGTPQEEIADGLRLAAISGRPAEILARLEQFNCGLPFESGLLALDVALASAAATEGIELPFYRPGRMRDPLPRPIGTGNPAVMADLDARRREAERLALVEDARLECGAPSAAVAIRRNWIAGEAASAKAA